jgi:hypothetical protein
LAHPTSEQFKDTKEYIPQIGVLKNNDYDPNFKGGIMITHSLELAELAFLTEEAKYLNSLEVNETKHFLPGYARLCSKRRYDFSARSKEDNL